MIERDWITKKLNPILKKERPDICWFKLGDTFGGHKKPCDGIMVKDRETLFVEVKESNKSLTPNELMSAIKVASSGGLYYILRYYPNKHISWQQYGSNDIDIFDDIDHFIIWL